MTPVPCADLILIGAEGRVDLLAHCGQRQCEGAPRDMAEGI